MHWWFFPLGISEIELKVKVDVEVKVKVGVAWSDIWYWRIGDCDFSTGEKNKNGNEEKSGSNPQASPTVGSNRSKEEQPEDYYPSSTEEYYPSSTEEYREVLPDEEEMVSTQLLSGTYSNQKKSTQIKTNHKLDNSKLSSTQ